jgi:hypothetical protein
VVYLQDILIEVSLAYKKLNTEKLTILEDKKKYEFKDFDTFEFLDTILFLVDIQNKDAIEKIEFLGFGKVAPFKTNLTLTIKDKIYYLKYKDLKNLKKMDRTLSGSILKSNIKID